MKKKQAFNLAEVLMTLVIIGIISAIALPGLRKNVNNKQYEAGMSKAYLNFSQAWDIILTENKGYVENLYPNSRALADEFIGEHRGRQLIRGRYCNAKDKCFGKEPMGAVPTGFTALMTGSDARMVLDDGTVVAMYLSNAGCKGTAQKTVGGATTLIKSGICALVWFDMNGNEIPNTYGKDAYGFFITKNGFEPGDPDYIIKMR